MTIVRPGEGCESLGNWGERKISIMLKPGNNDITYKTKAFPYNAEAFPKYAIGSVTRIMFKAIFMFFRLHGRFVLNVP